MRAGLSILIPTYNYSVHNLVEELQKQALVTNQPYEIVVLDDASELEIERNKIIDDWQNCSYEKLTTNVGRTAARSKLMEKAQYDWLLFLDADVLPKGENFLKNYLNELSACDVVFGGIAYAEKRPANNLILRWKYGRAREAKTVSERNKAPHFIISQNLLIKKDVFRKANIVNESHYGLDNLFSNQLLRLGATVKHIDNPVVHLGLEPNEKFLSKALKAVETTVIFEKKGLMDEGLRPSQKAYNRLKKWGMLSLFQFLMKNIKGKMERNFKSAEPNLFWFDLYRLHHYINLKRKHA
ncbi:MAG: glycosyltransferase family 2 protein [Flavobacteriaceae bacterium]|nr:glycosyltransferase family 2 protein [Flavobacteriaceae bacterium]